MVHPEEKVRKFLGLGPKKFKGQGRRLGSTEGEDGQGASGSGSSSGRQRSTQYGKSERSGGSSGGVTAFQGKARTLSDPGKPDTSSARRSDNEPTPSRESPPQLPSGVTTGSESVDMAIRRLFGAKDVSSLRVVSKLLANVLTSPEESKYRWVRKGNEKVGAALSSCENAGEEIARFVGFSDVEGDVDGGDWLNLPREEDGEELSRAKAALDALGFVMEALGSRRVKEGPPIGPENREERAYKPSDMCSAFMEDLPAEFYELTPEELKQELEKRKVKNEVGSVVTTKDRRERQLELVHRHRGGKGKRPEPEECVIRVRMPDGLIAQGKFRPEERVKALLEWVRSVCSSPEREFALHLAGTRVDDREEESVKAVGLFPGGLLNLSWKDAPQGDSPSLRHDLAASALPLE